MLPFSIVPLIEYVGLSNPLILLVSPMWDGTILRVRCRPQKHTRKILKKTPISTSSHPKMMARLGFSMVVAQFL